ncbi:hypothetical protein CPJCM30710_19100 [Clostridium polyendosporum]|uniref:tRNA(Ile2) 2-agmatinylcytidine synthetase n=1 Tax=Clostridium polyendosporum TaxID=69208 RepID=A0A919RZT1_9CLOT|nr:hypothetical protein [Clostridium polyendosporum]GIM29244.1 hypothetical protein CPJCM30710_19100 [Clostridium polyendosporum]
MYILLCIDDTDSIDSRGTGTLAEIIANTIESSGWGKRYAVTRHQLLLHKDIPYTSHNSSMCFGAEIEAKYLQNIIDYTVDFLQRESEPESDPGLCVVVVDYLKDNKKLIDFGYKAKRVVLTKENAYDLAKELKIHLSEHGGTGQGIIGALAGAGLRLSGNDGWFKGSHKIKTSDNIIKVSELCSYNNIDKVRSVEGRYLEDDEMIALGNLVKTVLVEGEFVLLVDEVNEESCGVKWKTCSKQQLRKYEEMKFNVVHK